MNFSIMNFIKVKFNEEIQIIKKMMNEPHFFIIYLSYFIKKVGGMNNKWKGEN